MKRPRSPQLVSRIRKGVRLRKFAYQVLWAVDRGATADAVLEKFRAQLRERRDRDFLTEVVQGVLRQQARLDYIMHHIAGSSYYQIGRSARILIRVGLYQLFFMERVPAYAAVHATTEVSRHISGVSTRLVHAILRRAAELEHWETILPDRVENPIRYLAVRYSFPQWIVRRWVDWWGEEKTERILTALQQHPPVYIRRHMELPDDRFVQLLAEQGLTVERVASIPDCFRVVRGVPQRTAAFRRGYFAIQDAASQIVPLLTRVEPGQMVLDACAAPGNKTTRLIQDMQYTGTIVVADISIARMRETVTNLMRWLQKTRLQTETFRIWPVVTDMRMPALVPDRQFDCVLVDAPCSNLGVAHRHPEVKWRLTPEKIAQLGDLQVALLTGVASYVRPGGHLVYAVCTLEREETHDVIERFLHERPDFYRIRLDTRDWPVPIRQHVQDRYYWVVWPDVAPMDGFFGVVFRRKRIRGRVHHAHGIRG